MKQLIIRLDDIDHKDLKRLCLESGKTIQSLISDFIKKEIQKFKKKGGKQKKK